MSMEINLKLRFRSDFIHVKMDFSLAVHILRIAFEIQTSVGSF